MNKEMSAYKIKKLKMFSLKFIFFVRMKKIKN